MSIFRKKRKWNYEVDPDEILIDARNIPDFDTQQFEGVIEKTISKKSIYILSICFMMIGIIFISKIGILEIIRGEHYFTRSQENTLSDEPLFANRGIIYDRNGKELAWNDLSTGDNLFPTRTYASITGASHLLGYVNYPAKDNSGFYWQTDFVGQDGIEKQYNSLLSGKNGEIIAERDVHGNVISQNSITKPENGKNITLTIDKDIQEELGKKITEISGNAGYQGGAAVMMDIHTGEILGLANYPEYDSNVMSLKQDSKAISSYFTDSRHPFLNRVIDGKFPPGSIVKPFVAMGALNEGVIDPMTKILSQDYITVANPYNPGQKYIFKDFHQNNGWLDMRHALGVSSNIYFFEVGGGYQNQKGIGISNIQKYANLFGIGEKTGIDLPEENVGVVPGPEWKAKNFPGDIWRIGDTYNTAIGQYGFQVTPIEMVRAVSAIANYGTLVTPHLLKDPEQKLPADTVLNFPKSDYDVIHDGMRLVATVGTGSAFSILPFHIGAKTGTAQVGDHNQYITSWAMTFFPFEKPKYALVTMMERGTSAGSIVGAQKVAREFLQWLGTNKPEYVAIDK